MNIRKILTENIYRDLKKLPGNPASYHGLKTEASAVSVPNFLVLPNQFFLITDMASVRNVFIQSQ